MPRPTRSQGRFGTRVIPADWETSHAPVVRKTFTAKCRINRQEIRPVANDDLSYSDEPTQTPLYDGGCRVQSLAGDSQTLQGDEILQRSSYLVALDYDAHGIAPGDVVTVYESNDPDFENLTLTVRAPLDGSLRFERDLYCVIDR